MHGVRTVRGGVAVQGDGPDDAAILEALMALLSAGRRCVDLMRELDAGTTLHPVDAHAAVRSYDSHRRVLHQVLRARPGVANDRPSYVVREVEET